MRAWGSRQLRSVHTIQNAAGEHQQTNLKGEKKNHIQDNVALILQNTFKKISSYFL